MESTRVKTANARSQLVVYSNHTALVRRLSVERKRLMLKRIFLVLALAAAMRFVYADDKPLFIARDGKVPVWVSPEHRVGEQPLHIAEPTELLLREDAKGDYLKVVTQNGAKGWVEVALVRPYERKVGATVDLGEGKIAGQLDNPGDVYILTDDSKIPPEGFYIQRDLTALIIGDNVDRETLERKNGENF
jgi:hypothetical protein